MRQFKTAVLMLLLAGCAMLSPPPKPASRPAPVARRQPAPDWFQLQLAAARRARASHLPATDTAGAQAAYDKIVRDACTRVAISGPEKYQARCEGILRQPDSNDDAFACDDSVTDPTALRACND